MRRTDHTSASWLPAQWRAPAAIRAGSTTRIGGASAGPFESFNLAAHVGDVAASVDTNRRQLRRMLGLPAEPCWLEQHHGTTVIDAGHDDTRHADGSYSAERGRVCAVLSADCVPVMLCDRAGSEIAAVHAGWRGICGGVIRNAVAKFHAPAAELLAWLGPHIQKDSYPVGDDMRQACLDGVPGAEQAFDPAGPGRWRADLALLACNALRASGVSVITHSGLCTFRDTQRFYSYRSDAVTGRMATLIWMV